MIRSFRHRGLKRLYERSDASKINQNQRNRIEILLTALDAAIVPTDMDKPGYHFHRLKGDLKDFYSVRVTGNWRIIFRFEEEPEDVDLDDYH